MQSESATKLPAPKLCDLEISKSFAVETNVTEKNVASAVEGCEDWLEAFKNLGVNDVNDSSDDTLADAINTVVQTILQSGNGSVGISGLRNTASNDVAQQLLARRAMRLAATDQTSDPIADIPNKKAKFHDFFDFPVELRTILYFLVLRPDCSLRYPKFCDKYHKCAETHKECTAILRTCSKIYIEAIEMLYKHEPLVDVKASRAPMFRDMKDFGQPELLTCKKPEFQCPIPPKYTELSMLRFRKIAIVIHDPYHSSETREELAEYSRKMGILQKKVACVCAALEKSRNIQQIRVMVIRAGEYDDVPHMAYRIAGLAAYHPLPATVNDFGHLQLQEVMRPLLNTALRCNIPVHAEEWRLLIGFFDVEEHSKPLFYAGSFEDPLVTWANSLASHGPDGNFDRPYRRRQCQQVTFLF